MILRPADESRVFHENGGRLAHPKVFTGHPRWGGHFQDGHESQAIGRAEPAQSKIPRWHKYFFFGSTALVALIVLTGGIGSQLYYKNRVLPGVKLSSISLEGKTESQTKTAVATYVKQFSIGVDGPHPQTLSPQQIGLVFDVDKTVDAIMRQGKSGIIVPYMSGGQAGFVFKLDEQKFKQYLVATNQVDQSPQDASIEIKSGTVVITPEKDGKSYGLDPDKSKFTILQSIKDGENPKLKIQSYVSRPAVTASMLESSKALAEKMIGSAIKLQINDQQIVPTPTHISSWLKVSAGKDGAHIEADPVLVGAYLDAVAKPYVKPPRAKVVIKDADGTERILSDGASGVDIINKDNSAKEIAAAVTSQQGYDKALAIAFADPKTITAADYPKWLDVDITNKRMYAYEHGVVVKEFLITSGAPLTPTVKGQYTIQSKVRRQDMRGFNANGTRYYQPDVEYINYFYQDYAIHGNYWRPASVFGNVNTSHGCVGIVNADALWVWNWAPVGTPVIVHS
jgi:lipoprotein-anchoring transpeptidase ErfK/SrfK